ncbi:MAG: MerR family transcriptional regulator [Lachnospiraceae bacterium]|nr:MerR family transcriptional regulator [Lachnospiraceae bacterium]
MTIKEVSKNTGLTADTLRYYEKIGMIPIIRRDENGIRSYNDSDIRLINFVLRLKRAGMTLEKIIEYVELAKEGDSTAEARKKLLEEQRENIIFRISELKESLDLIDYKIEHYFSCVISDTKEAVENLK